MQFIVLGPMLILFSYQRKGRSFITFNKRSNGLLMFSGEELFFMQLHGIFATLGHELPLNKNVHYLPLSAFTINYGSI